MKILDVGAIPLSYWCEQPYMRAAGEQVARNTFDRIATFAQVHIRQAT